MTENTPELVQDVKSRTGTLSETVQQLQEFRKSVSGYRERVEGMDANEQEAFYQSAEQLRDRAKSATTPGELLELEDDIEEAIRSPLQQVAEESLEELLDLIQPDLSDEVRSQTFEKLESKIPAELDEVAAAYQDVYIRVDESPDILREVLAAFIQSEPSVLQNPDRDLTPTIEDLGARHEQLSELESAFEESGDWAPTFDFAEMERFYSDRSGDINVSTIKSKITAIGNAVNTLADGAIQAGELVNEQLRSWYETSDLDQLLPTLREIEDDVSSAVETYDNITSTMNSFEDYDSSSGVFKSELDELESAYTQLEIHDYSSLEELDHSLDELKEQLDDFIDSLHKRLKAQKDLVEQLDAPEGESPPQIHLGTQGTPLLRMHVEDNPTQALEDCDNLHNWITTHLKSDTGTIDQAEMLNIWQSLSRGDEIQLTEENRETIMALADRLPLSVVLSGT